MVSLPKSVDVSIIKKLAVPVETISEFPPGLEPPPGLGVPPGLGGEVEIEQPPGLEDQAPTGRMATFHASADSFEEAIRAFPLVRITGIPDMLMNRPTMDTVFQQARLEHAIVGYSMERGPKCGEVRVSLSTADAVPVCFRHFSGRQWVPGVIVKCEVVPPAIPKAIEEASVLSPSAPAFAPASSSSTLSADAPSFVPSYLRPETKVLGEPAKVHLSWNPAAALGVNEQTDTPNSDASTDTGESASECE